MYEANRSNVDSINTILRVAGKLKTGYLGANGSFAPCTYSDSPSSLMLYILPVQHSSYDGGAAIQQNSANFSCQNYRSKLLIVRADAFASVRSTKKVQPRREKNLALLCDPDEIISVFDRDRRSSFTLSRDTRISIISRYYRFHRV